jgi:DNA repair protein RadA/Sms
MLRTSAAMLPSPSTLRSLLHLSRRSILLPNPRLPSPALLADLRLLSSSPSPSDGGGWSGSHNPLAGKEAVKGKRTLNLGSGVVRWSVVAAARRGGPGKAAKANVSYVCSNCGEGSSQWWGMCCHCKAMGTLTKYVIPEPDSASDEGSQSHHALRSWIPQKSKEMVPLCLPDVTKGFDQAEWRIPL